MKTNYNKARLPKYLLSMGSSLIAAHLNSGRDDDPTESAAPGTQSEPNPNDRSSWRLESETEDLGNENELNHQGENPYEGRRIGAKRNEKKKTIGKKKGPLCEKGFNVKSIFLECHRGI